MPIKRPTPPPITPERAAELADELGTIYAALEPLELEREVLKEMLKRFTLNGYVTGGLFQVCIHTEERSHKDAKAMEAKLEKLMTKKAFTAFMKKITKPKPVTTVNRPTALGPKPRQAVA